MDSTSVNTIPATDDVAEGLGLVTFFADGACTAMIRSVSNEAWHRGSFVKGVGLNVETDEIALTLKAVERPTESGPRMRGNLVLKDTGVSTRVVGWRVKLEDGSQALGISADRPLPNRVDLPF